MSDKLVKIYTDSEITLMLLKAQLEENGISSLIKNEFRSGIMAGFGAGTVTSAELYIYANDVDAAQPIIDDFLKHTGEEEQL